jgi:hypothetical protein
LSICRVWRVTPTICASESKERVNCGQVSNEPYVAQKRASCSPPRCASNPALGMGTAPNSGDSASDFGLAIESGGSLNRSSLCTGLRTRGGKLSPSSGGAPRHGAVAGAASEQCPIDDSAESAAPLPAPRADVRVSVPTVAADSDQLVVDSAEHEHVQVRRAKILTIRCTQSWPAASHRELPGPRWSPAYVSCLYTAQLGPRTHGKQRLAGDRMACFNHLVAMRQLI